MMPSDELQRILDEEEIKLFQGLKEFLELSKDFENLQWTK